MPSLINQLFIVLSIAVRAPFAVRPRDISLFLRSGRTDAAIGLARRGNGARAAFETAYTHSPDPWGSDDPRFHYQRRKCEAVLSLLPAGRRYSRVLDLGSGLGMLTRLLSPHSDHVLGLDVAQAAVDLATSSRGLLSNVEYRQGDVTSLPTEMDGLYDLVVITDTLYYLDKTDENALAVLTERLSALLAPGGLILIANHYFSPWDTASRLTRSIHNAFLKLETLHLVSERYRAFYLASLIQMGRNPPYRVSMAA